MTAATGMNRRRPLGYSSSSTLRTWTSLAGWSVSLPVTEIAFFSVVMVACRDSVSELLFGWVGRADVAMTAGWTSSAEVENARVRALGDGGARNERDVRRVWFYDERRLIPCDEDKGPSATRNGCGPSITESDVVGRGVLQCEGRRKSVRRPNTALPSGWAPISRTGQHVRLRMAAPGHALYTSSANSDTVGRLFGVMTGMLSHLGDEKRVSTGQRRDMADSADTADLDSAECAMGAG